MIPNIGNNGSNMRHGTRIPTDRTVQVRINISSKVHPSMEPDTNKQPHKNQVRKEGRHRMKKTRLLQNLNGANSGEGTKQRDGETLPGHKEQKRAKHGAVQNAKHVSLQMGFL